MSSNKTPIKSILKRPILPKRYENKGLFNLILQSQIASAQWGTHTRHFWRYRLDLSQPGVIPRETSLLHRKYDSPIGILLSVEEQTADKPLTPVGTAQQIDNQIRIDLAECIRLGEIFKTKDGDESFPHYFYLPKSGDVYQWRGSLYEIQDVVPDTKDFYEPLQIFLVWTGDAKQFITDSSDPNLPLAPLTSEPVFTSAAAL